MSAVASDETKRMQADEVLHFAVRGVDGRGERPLSACNAACRWATQGQRELRKEGSAIGGSYCTDCGKFSAAAGAGACDDCAAAGKYSAGKASTVYW